MPAVMRATGMPPSVGLDSAATALAVSPLAMPGGLVVALAALARRLRVPAPPATPSPNAGAGSACEPRPDPASLDSGVAPWRADSSGITYSVPAGLSGSTIMPSWAFT